MSKNEKKVSTKKDCFPIVITMAFALVIALGMFFHELWRDELEIYGRLAFTNNLLMEGDVASIFYYAYLKCCMLLNNSQTMFQIAHFLILIPTIYIFVKHAKIPNLQKLLLVFSYFMVFDYGIISRYYGFTVLLLFIITYLLTQPKKNYLVIVALLLIFANHSIQSTIFAASISVYLVLEAWHTYRRKELVVNGYFISAIVLFLVGWSAILASHYFVTLGNASYNGGGRYGFPPFFINIKFVWNAFIPLPKLNSGVGFWNTNIVPYTIIFEDGYNVWKLASLRNIIAFFISVYMLCVIVAKFSEKPLVAILFLVNTVIYLVFLEYLRVYYMRYQGFLFVIFLYNYWLYTNASTHSDFKLLQPVTRYFEKKNLAFLKKSFTPMLYIILCAQVFAAFNALSKDIKYKFTLSQDAATYVTAHNLNKTHVMVGYIDFVAQTVAIHTQTKMYFPQVKHFGYYQEPFNKSRMASVPNADILSVTKYFAEKQHKKVLLVSSWEFTDDEILNFSIQSPNSSIKLLKSFTGAIIQADEQFWLYEVKKKR